jgi:hypothetical protein
MGNLRLHVALQHYSQLNLVFTVRKIVSGEEEPPNLQIGFTAKHPPDAIA